MPPASAGVAERERGQRAECALLRRRLERLPDTSNISERAQPASEWLNSERRAALERMRALGCSG